MTVPQTKLARSADTRQASSWRAVQATQDQLRHEAELRVRPNEEAGVALMCLTLCVLGCIGWWIFG